MQCAHCDIVLTDRPYVASGGKTYCCERCLRAHQRMEEAYAERERAHLQLIEALVRSLDAREGETANHSQRVAHYTHLLGRLLGIAPEDCLHICRGALLHDIGKIGIPDAILHKPGQLTDEEWRVMRRHPEIGARILGGLAYEMTGSYDLVWILSIAFGIASAIINLPIIEKPVVRTTAGAMSAAGGTS